ncbi:MAG: hypothetical protein NPIRA01_33090 [Nitrospirales bacterium]|nr:MAG: hypothetical protein NPIRA01_33090 [Nitrospirales bacterium]
MARKLPPADVKILYAKAAGRCAFSSCRVNVVLDGTEGDKSKQIGKIAHIVAHRPNGPRGDSSFPKEKLDCYDNWMLLCPTCHDVVDAQESEYSTVQLHEIKNDHESWVFQQLDESMSEVSFAELEIATKAIASGKHFISGSFHVIPPGKKIKTNKFTSEVHVLISTGLSRSKEVSDFIVKMAQLDKLFPDRLKDGFNEEYLKLKETLSGDALFMAMLDFSQAGQTDFKQQAASLAILSHLFHICEVFEK